jgi:hypothetical protein
MMANFDSEHEKILHEMLGSNPTAKASKMFGYPAYKVNGKLAVGLFDGGVTAKVGPERAKELIGQDGITVFEPMEGRAWKDWIMMTGNFEKHRAIFEEAVQYVLEETSA